MNKVQRLIYNKGEQLVPYVSHNDEELVGHRSAYAFFYNVIASDLKTNPLPSGTQVSIADLGFGTGYGCALMSGLPNSIITGVDIGDQCEISARQYYSRSNVTYVIEDLKDFIPKMIPFDYAVSRGVLEHVPNGLSLINDIKANRRIMVDVPYDGIPGNEHHVLTGMRKVSSAHLENYELFYEDLEGQIYSADQRPIKANMIIVVISAPHLPKVSSLFQFPISPVRNSELDILWQKKGPVIRIKEALEGIPLKSKNFLMRTRYYLKTKILQRKYKGEEKLYSNHVEEVFKNIYKENYWGNKESRSGNGSDLAQTKIIRNELSSLIEEMEIKSMLDLPCGDFNWMKMLKINADYIGADIVPEMIEQNKTLYENEKCKFLTLDIIKDIPPIVDLIFCRDLMVHLSIQDVKSALMNMVNSGSKYLLTTTFTNRDINLDIPTGYWRPLNLQLEPFKFPDPLKLINENCTEDNGNWTDKCLGLWRLQDILRKIS